MIYLIRNGTFGGVFMVHVEKIGTEIEADNDRLLFSA
jgi:hypothetical protein